MIGKLPEFKLITTGGTIDGDLKTLQSESGVVSFLRKFKDVYFNQIVSCNKDSREIDETDRLNLLKLINEAKEDFIIITHGTFTICETGRFLKKKLVDCNKLVLLVGAWIAINQPESDAEKQILFALDSLKTQSLLGVWIAMDDKLWDPERTVKSRYGKDSYSLTEVTD